jgi:hypothetical protein
MQVSLKFGLKGCEAKELRNVEVRSLLTHESEDVFFFTVVFDVPEILGPCAAALAATFKRT